MQEYKLWIDGKWTDSQGGSQMEIENPATGSKIAHVVNASQADVDAAVQAAKAAFYDGRWSRKTPSERSLALLRLADLVEANAEKLAKAESENTGKPYAFVSLGADLPFMVDNLRFFAAAARDTHGSHAGEFMSGYTSMYRREPVGVVGQIAPWNYPLMMAIWKIGPALAAGCTVVLKPAPTTPLTTLMLAELAAEAGIPDGVLNIVSGGNETGQAIVEHPDVRMVSLTGSSGTGTRVMQTAAKTLKRVHLELGGKAPILVFEDADLDLAIEKITLGATFNTGQDCTAATRVYAAQNLYEDAKEALVEAMRAVKVGDPFSEDTEVGPLISRVQFERVQGFIERARKTSAQILTGGGVPAGLEKGYYFSPTVISDVDQKSEIVQSEVFGPVITVQPFNTEEEAVYFGNDVLYGLAAALFTKDLGRAMRVSSQLEFGTIWINDHIPLTSETPHGGFKQSGFGKDLSAEAVNDYQITKHVMISHIS
ncbi:MAG: gamma-aminobutyraldehyde dehydrogenase [Anaerolineales bacterium]|nr:MAG: gamma-aminobutyraldehyde dehydrogenase [Anaerolineales bacterium]